MSKIYRLEEDDKMGIYRQESGVVVGRLRLYFLGGKEKRKR